MKRSIPAVWVIFIFSTYLLKESSLIISVVVIITCLHLIKTYIQQKDFVSGGAVAVSTISSLYSFTTEPKSLYAMVISVVAAAIYILIVVVKELA